MLTCKIALPDSPHPRIIILLVKVPDFGHFISLDGKNSVFSFNRYEKIFFFIFGCWLLSEKFIVCPTQGWSAAASQSPPRLVRLWSKYNSIARVVRGYGPPNMIFPLALIVALIFNDGSVNALPLWNKNALAMPQGANCYRTAVQPIKNISLDVAPLT